MNVSAVVSLVGPLLRVRPGGSPEAVAAELLPGETWGRLTYNDVLPYAGRAVDADPDSGTISAVGGKR
jgi:hypothetical protein